MYWIFVILIFVIGVCGFFWWANHRTRKEHATFAKEDVISAIENVLSNGRHDQWDLFLAWPIDDSYLEGVRHQCLAISSEHSEAEKGKDIATAGETKLRVILNELKTSV